MRERRVKKKGDDQMARREWGRTCRNYKYLCVQKRGSLCTN
jgi:hypothetical protein